MLHDDQMVFASKPSTLHSRHKLTASRMKRIMDPYFERRTPGIVTLVRLASAKVGSLQLLVTKPVATTAPLSTNASPSSSLILLWRAVMVAMPAS